MKAPLTLLAATILLSGCGSSSSGRAPSTAVAGVSSSATPTPTPQTLSTTYLGSYQTPSDSGRALLFVYPNGVCSGWVASTQDPTRRDVFLAELSGTSLNALGMLGSGVQVELSTLSANWDGVAIQLERANPSGPRAYAGTTVNETLLVGGLWSGIVDPNGDVTALFSYPTLGFVSDVLQGQLSAQGDLDVVGARDRCQGRLENGLAAGRWVALDGSQRGSWHGSLAPGWTAPRTAGISGAYVGSYTSTAGVREEGLLGVVIYPDGSFVAAAASTLDPRRLDVGVGLVAADATPLGVLTWGGTTVSSGTLNRGGTYDAPDHSGTFSLAPAQGDQLHAGLFIDSQFSAPGTWLSIGDGQGNVAAVTAYPALLTVGETAQGVVDANGSLNVTTASGAQVGGRFEGGMSGGHWVSANGAERGWWTGFRLQ